MNEDEIYQMEREDDPDPVDEEIHQMEREEPPRPNPNLTYQPIHPVLSQKQYNSLVGRYMTPEIGPKEIEPNTVYFDPYQKQIKFLLLPKAVPNAYTRLLPILESVKWQHCARAANGQKHGKKITVGWLPQLPGRAIGSRYYNVRTKETLDQPQLAYGLKAPVKRDGRKNAGVSPHCQPESVGDCYQCRSQSGRGRRFEPRSCSSFGTVR
jgi:hypothetical protein